MWIQAEYGICGAAGPGTSGEEIGVLTGVELETVIVLCSSQVTFEVHIMVYDLVRDWVGTRCMESVAQVVQVYELKSKGSMRDVCSLCRWLAS